MTYENGRRRWLHADERGSVVATTDDGGQIVGIFGYTGSGDTYTSSGRIRPDRVRTPA